MFIFFISLIFVVSYVQAQDDNADIVGLNRKVLVLLDQLDYKRSHSSFFRSLTEQGFQLTFAHASSDSKIALSEYGEYLYDNLILFAPKTKKFGGFVDTKAVLEFIDSGRNVLIAGDQNVAKPTKEIAAQNNIAFDASGSVVIDHFQFDKSNDNGDRTLIRTNKSFQPLNTERIFGTKKTTELLYRGIALKPDDSSLLVPLIQSYGTAYAGVPSKVADDDTIAGQLNLVVAMQGRNSARVVVSGSVDMFSNDLINAAKESDVALARLSGMAAWTFQQRGRLRASKISHQALVPSSDGHYRIKQQVRYEVTLSEWDGAAQQWTPFVADDVQLEFRMLDPYVRQTLQHAGQGRYTLEFALPDVYGVFTFRTLYNRAGLSPLTTVTRVPVRPLRHDEYERFIVSAYPYYASSFSMLIGLFLFSFVFLYHRDKSNNNNNAASANNKKTK